MRSDATDSPSPAANNPAMDRVKMTFETDSPEATHALGCVLGSVLWAGDFLALHGQLGAGKTALVRGIAAGLGLDARAVSSPTFVIASEYTQGEPGSAPIPLVHMDAYRLSGEEDLETAGWDAACDGAGVVAVEWAEKVAGALERAAGPARRNLADVTLEATAAESRRITFDAPASWARRPGGGWNSLAARATSSSEPRAWTVCPTTGKKVPPDAPTWPFIDERARLADLHKWLTGRYVVSRELRQDDLE